MTTGDIRKISVGMDYPNKVMHYQKGNKINLLGVSYIISDIIKEVNYMLGKVSYNIFVTNSNGKVLWKTIEGVPVILEYNIAFN
jgi:hypothetical protein